MIVYVNPTTEADRPVCGWCGHTIPDVAARLDPRGVDENGNPRAVHVGCETPFRATLDRSRREREKQDAAAEKKRIDNLKNAVVAAWTAYLNWGPVDDGSPEGKALEVALDGMAKAAVKAGAKFPKRRKRKA